MEKKKRTTNTSQFRVLIDFMKENADIAKNDVKRRPEIVNNLWNNLKIELNSLGPPLKEISEWKKVWSDYKSFLKKKLANEKKEKTATGGGPNKLIVFTSQEEEVIQLLSLKECVQGLPKRSFGVPIQVEPSLNENEIIIFDESVEDEINAGQSNLSFGSFLRETPKIKKKRKENLLEKQISIQESIGINFKEALVNQNLNNENLNKIKRSIDRLYDAQKASNKIQQDQLEEQKRHNKKFEEINVEKNELKKKLLEIKLEKNNLMLSM